MTGIKPQEFYYHCMAGREVRAMALELCNTAFIMKKYKILV
jgi:hypothetical protein